VDWDWAICERSKRASRVKLDFMCVHTLERVKSRFWGNEEKRLSFDLMNGVNGNGAPHNLTNFGVLFN
jgi:hypothetical protein